MLLVCARVHPERQRRSGTVLSSISSVLHACTHTIKCSACMHAHYYMHANKKNRNLLRRTARRPRVGPLQTNALESPADAEGTCIYWQLSTLFLSSSNSLASGIQLAAARTPPASTACHLRPGYRSIYAQRQCILSQTECCEHSI